MRKNILVWILAMCIAFPVKLYSQQKAGAAFKQEFLDRINYTRAKGCKCGTTFMKPVPPLIWNDILEGAALAHARDMGEHNYFSHESLTGKTSSDRIIGAGYNYTNYKSFAVGENIAMGQQSIDEVMKGWFKSEGHCKNLMSSEFKEIGVAQYDIYWVQDFGGRVAFTPDQQKMIKSGRMKIISRGMTSE